MNRKLFLLCVLVLFFLCCYRGMTQSYIPLQECGYEELMNRYRALGAQFYTEKPIGNRDDETVLKIPVVFHVVVPPTHTGNAFDYIAPYKIYESLDILNTIFAGESPYDTVNVNTNIKFFPATIDIYGDSLYIDYQCERYFGITYDFQNDLSEYEDININRNGHIVTYPYSWEEASNCDNDYYNVFSQEKYLNIWIFDDVGEYNGMGGSVVWYGHSCGLVALPKKVVGINGEVGHELGYGIAHEVGHYFSLSHPWPDYGVPFRPCDVFPHSESFSECDTIDFRHNNERVSCNNIMEYTPDGCRSGFSQGQKDTMRAVIGGWFSELTDCENYIYQGSRLSMFSTEIVSPVENIVCINTPTDIKINFPDTAVFRGLKIYRNNEIVASLYRQNTIRRTSTSFSFNYTFNEEGNYELAVYCGRGNCEARVCSRAILVVGCEALTTGLEKAQWYFDKKVSLDLSSGLAILKYDSQMDASCSESSICDNNGNLLFYTDGNRIWDSQHDLQDERLEDASNKGTIILKFTDDKYAIITLTSSNILKGRIINVENNGISVSPIVSTIWQDSELYGLTAVLASDGKYWLISSKETENHLYPFLIKVNEQLGVQSATTMTDCELNFAGTPKYQ